jgi:hypothetical protein
MRIGDTVRVSYEGTISKDIPAYIQLTNGTCFTKQGAKIEVIKRIYSIGEFCYYYGSKHMVAAIVDGYYVLSAPGLKPRLLEV